MSLPTYYELRTFDDLVNATIETLRVQSTDQNTINRIKRNINTVYKNSVVSASRSWSWLNQTVVINTQPYYTNGTVSVTQNKAYVTFSSPVPGSRKNWFLNVEGADEVYQIYEHEDEATSATLTTRFAGKTNATARFRIWTDTVPLPADCKNIVSVVGAHREEPLDPISLQQIRKYQTRPFNALGKPEYYCDGPRVLPSPYRAYDGLSNPVSRESRGNLKILYFNQDPSQYIQANDRIRVQSGLKFEYDGNVTVTLVDPTNYSIQYTSRVPRTETNTAVSNPNEIQVFSIIDGAQEPYPTLLLHPSMDQYNHLNTLVVDYQLTPEALVIGTDEPRIPIEHRQVLFFGAMWLSCDRDTDNERALEYKSFMDAEIQRMIALTTLPMKTPKLMFSNDYIKSKGRLPRRRLIVS